MSARGSPRPDDKQEQAVEDANQKVRKRCFFMKRALDEGNLREALKHASDMIYELKTSKLGPQKYYELYLNVTNELRHLEMFLKEAAPTLKLDELYEEVQHAGNIIPRLYLLATVGSVYIGAKQAKPVDILFDLLEMIKGVQHPTRGLFLRNYLSQMSKDKLPETRADFASDQPEEQREELTQIIDFVLKNFGEMTMLWVRMQHQGAVRDRSRREQERRKLQMVVGSNLSRLSHLDTVDCEVYASLVLPRLLQQIVDCKDKIAQEYLSDLIIQVFPDEFHLATLETFLANIPQLKDTVDAKQIMIAMMDRLAPFVTDNRSAVPDDLDMFSLFHKYAQEISEKNEKLKLKDKLVLQRALASFASKVYPDELSYVNHVLGATKTALEASSAEELAECSSKIAEIIVSPVEALQLRVLDLDNWTSLVDSLPFDEQRITVAQVLKELLKGGDSFHDPVKLDAFLTFCQTAIKDQKETPALEDSTRFEFEEEQHLVARLISLIAADDTDSQFECLKVARKHFGQGGPNRLPITLPPLIFQALRLAKLTHARDGEEGLKYSAKKAFGFIHETITALVELDSETALRLFLHATQIADAAAFEVIAYEFMSQAFSIYEEEIADSKAQFAAIQLITATLYECRHFDQDNYETLATKVTKHAAKQVKKPLQAQSVSQCAHMFWQHQPGSSSDKSGKNGDNVEDDDDDEDETSSSYPCRDSKTVLQCLQRSLKIANNIMNEAEKVAVFLQILDKYIYFFELGCDSIDTEMVSNLIALVHDLLSGLEEDQPCDALKATFKAAVRHVRLKQRSADDAIKERFANVTFGN